MSVDVPVPLRRCCYFVKSGEGPLPGMLHNFGPEHVQGDEQQIAGVFPCFARTAKLLSRCGNRKQVFLKAK